MATQASDSDPKKKRKVGLDGLVIAELFFRKYVPGVTRIEFVRDDYDWALAQVKEKHPQLFSKLIAPDDSPDAVEISAAISKHKNIGAVIYDFRFRRNLPAGIRETEQPEKGLFWRISLTGKGKYCFVLGPNPLIVPSPNAPLVEVFEAIPEVIAEYSFDDEQALLAKVRYNRLIDTFLGITAHSLQNHLRTSVDEMGQIEIDELYVGHDSDGKQYVVPVQAKGKKDKLSKVQTEQDLAFCRTHEKFRSLVPRPVSAQFLPDGRINLFELGLVDGEVTVVNERCYRFRSATGAAISSRVSPESSTPLAFTPKRRPRSVGDSGSSLE